MTDNTGLSPLLRLIVTTLYRLKIYDIENIPLEGGCVIAWNHVSKLTDAFTLSAFKKRRPDCITFGGFRVVALMKRRAARKGRENEGSKVLTAYKARGFSAVELLKSLRFLQEGRAIALAAEGEVTWDGRLQHPLAPGAAWMALRGHVPVVPLVQIGGYDVHPRWKKLPYLTGKVTIRAGKPFYIHDTPHKNLTNEMISNASQRIYDEMATLFALGHGSQLRRT